MKKFQTFSGVAVPMADHNIDTDRIIPARFLKTIKRTGLGVNLFNDVHREIIGGAKMGRQIVMRFSTEFK